MSLLTTPLVVNDGTADRTFNWLYQVPGDSLGGNYNEPAASAARKSELRSLHMTAKSGQERHMLQSSEIVALVEPGSNDPASDAIIINLTVSHNPKHASADVEKRVKILLASAGTVGFVARLMARNI